MGTDHMELVQGGVFGPGLTFTFVSVKAWECGTLGPALVRPCLACLLAPDISACRLETDTGNTFCGVLCTSADRQAGRQASKLLWMPRQGREL